MFSRVKAAGFFFFFLSRTPRSFHSFNLGIVLRSFRGEAYATAWYDLSIPSRPPLAERSSPRNLWPLRPENNNWPPFGGGIVLPSFFLIFTLPAILPLAVHPPFLVFSTTARARFFSWSLRYYTHPCFLARRFASYESQCTFLYFFRISFFVKYDERVRLLDKLVNNTRVTCQLFIDDTIAWNDSLNCEEKRKRNETCARVDVHERIERDM